uniref:Uncharacterized protein n=1 Tax=Panagrellus redivivus TaxID=6233 RepID=A0A7E4UQP2_PANRE
MRHNKKNGNASTSSESRDLAMSAAGLRHARRGQQKPARLLAPGPKACPNIGILINAYLAKNGCAKRAEDLNKYQFCGYKDRLNAYLFSLNLSNGNEIDFRSYDDFEAAFDRPRQTACSYAKVSKLFTYKTFFVESYVIYSKAVADVFRTAVVLIFGEAGNSHHYQKVARITATICTSRLLGLGGQQDAWILPETKNPLCNERPEMRRD